MKLYLTEDHLKLLSLPLITIAILYFARDELYKTLPIEKPEHFKAKKFTKKIQNYMEIERLKNSYLFISKTTQDKERINRWLYEKMIDSKRFYGRQQLAVQKNSKKKVYYSLQGIIIGKNRRAIINQKLVKPYSKVDGATVLKITEDRVLIKSKGEKIWLKLIK